MTTLHQPAAKRGRGRPRTWTDDDLADAVSKSKSWFEVNRRLGLRNRNGKRAHADRLGLDYSHFESDQLIRSWTNNQLVAAIAASKTWVEVADRLGVARGANLPAVARAIGADFSHFPGKGRRHSWTVDELVDAIDHSKSWDEVNARMGLRSVSSIRTAAKKLGLSHAHFTDHRGRPRKH